MELYLKMEIGLEKSGEALTGIIQYRIGKCIDLVNERFFESLIVSGTGISQFALISLRLCSIMSF